MLNKTLALLLFILYLGLITYLSLATIKTASINVNNADKLVHTSVYAVFVVLLYFVLLKYNVSMSPILTAVICAIIYGIIIEVLQEQCTVNRHFDVLDILANSIGSLLAAVFLKIKGKAIVKIK